MSFPNWNSISRPFTIDRDKKWLSRIEPPTARSHELSLWKEYDVPRKRRLGYLLFALEQGYLVS